MAFLFKLGKIIILFVMIYLWNKYVVPSVIKLLTNFHRKYNSENLNRQPIKGFIKNEEKIIKFAQLFYAIAAVYIAISILLE